MVAQVARRDDAVLGQRDHQVAAGVRRARMGEHDLAAAERYGAFLAVERLVG